MNSGDIGLAPASRETTQTNKATKHYAKTGSQNINSLLRKKETYPMGHSLHKGQSQIKRRLAAIYLNQKVVSLGDGWQVSGRLTDSLQMPSKLFDIRSALPTDSHSSPPSSPTNGGNDKLKTNTADLIVDHHLRGDWAFIRISLFLTLG